MADVDFSGHDMISEDAGRQRRAGAISVELRVALLKGAISAG
ncbi:MAG: hypothetical protein ABI612_02730 [Betaproteobacteria bacterium]